MKTTSKNCFVVYLNSVTPDFVCITKADVEKRIAFAESINKVARVEEVDCLEYLLKLLDAKDVAEAVDIIESLKNDSEWCHQYR